MKRKFWSGVGGGWWGERWVSFGVYDENKSKE
jgi:hypothetical protein